MRFAVHCTCGKIYTIGPPVGRATRPSEPIASPQAEDGVMTINLRIGLRCALAALLLTAVAGCSAMRAYRQCGLAGCPGDREISAKVRAVFAAHPALEPPNLIDVQTLDRVVYLSGIVDTDLERAMAESFARTVSGVDRVVDSIGLSGNR